jgi:3-hydroxymyristoyl/3-hydroxydecanoyl-(acyl carrier protein) dehydratase
MLTPTITLDAKQLQYFAEARYDMVFGTSYQHTRTFSFPLRFEKNLASEVILTEDAIHAKIKTPSDPQIFAFLIACHQFWLHPEMVKDGYALETKTAAPLSDNIALAYKEGLYFLDGAPLSFIYAFHPPYTKATQHNVFDKDALLHAVMGLPSKGFGEKLQKFDQGRFVPRLPAGDLLCIDHIEELEPNHCCSTYRPPNPCSFALILEAALQPCGWLSHHMGCLDSFDDDTYFRNLNGELTIRTPYKTDAPIVFDVKLLRTAKLGGKMIVNFAVEGHQNTQHILTMQTAFGYFSKQSLEKQGGFPEELPQHPYLPKAIPATLKANRQFMVEEILYADDKMIHCRRMLSPDDWYFKAHFFQDPVQPGSLGIQAFYDAIGLWAKKPVTPIGTCTWKYRGQTLPSHSVLDVTVTVKEITDDRLTFHGKLWVDGTCIYDLEQASVLV